MSPRKRQDPTFLSSKFTIPQRSGAEASVQCLQYQRHSYILTVRAGEGVARLVLVVLPDALVSSVLGLVSLAATAAASAATARVGAVGPGSPRRPLTVDCMEVHKYVRTCQVHSIDTSSQSSLYTIMNFDCFYVCHYCIL